MSCGRNSFQIVVKQVGVDVQRHRGRGVAEHLVDLDLVGEPLGVPLGGEPALVSLAVFGRAIADAVTRCTACGFVLANRRQGPSPPGLSVREAPSRSSLLALVLEAKLAWLC